MITVTISINGEPIFTRSARNTLKENSKGEAKYITDARRVIWHKRSRGAIALAKKILDTIDVNMEEK